MDFARISSTAPKLCGISAINLHSERRPYRLGDRAGHEPADSFKERETGGIKELGIDARAEGCAIFSSSDAEPIVIIGTEDRQPRRQSRVDGGVIGNWVSHEA